MDTQERMRILLDLTKAYEETNSYEISNRSNILHEIFLNINELPNDLKNQVNEGLYQLRYDYSVYLINERQTKDALSNLIKLQGLQKYSTFDYETKANIDRLISYSKLLMGLENNSADLISEAKELNYNLLLNLDKIEDEQIKKGIEKDEQIINAWYENDIKSIVEFEIPFPIFINEPIEFEYNNTRNIIELELIESPLSSIRSSGPIFAQIIEDKYGIAHRTKVKLTIFRYINPQNTVELDILSQDKRISETLLETIKVLNFFIERYRVVSNDYWIETVFHKMILNYNAGVFAGNISIHNEMNLFQQLLEISDYFPEIDIVQLNNTLKEEYVDLWKLLWLDSKDYLLRRNYRESIYAINGALENFLNKKARERLNSVLSQDEIEEFLDGKIEYEDFFLKDYINQESFQEAVNMDLIENRHPSVYKIVIKCHEKVPFDSSKKKLKSLVNKINRRRNAIAHGKDVNDNLEKDAKIAIESFEKLIELFNEN